MEWKQTGFAYFAIRHLVLNTRTKAWFVSQWILKVVYIVVSLTWWFYSYLVVFESRFKSLERLLILYQSHIVYTKYTYTGITRRKIRKLGWNSSSTAQLSFEDVRVPAKNIIGDEGSGFFYQMLQVRIEGFVFAYPCYM